MPKPSSIDRLPSDVRKALQGWLRDPAITQTEATERTNALLDELAAQRPEEQRAGRVSRHVVNRYDRRMRAACERLLQSRQATEVWVDKLGSAPAAQHGRLAAEIMRALVFDLAFRLQDREIDEKSMSRVVEAGGKISIMVERLERSREIALRCEREIKRQAAEEAASKARGAEPPPLDPERLREIVRQIYGVELQIQSPPSPLPEHHESRNEKNSSN